MSLTAVTVAPPGGETTYTYVNGFWTPPNDTWIVDVTICRNFETDAAAASAVVSVPDPRSYRASLVHSSTVEPFQLNRHSGTYACATNRYTYLVKPVSVDEVGEVPEGWSEADYSDTFGETASATHYAHYRGTNPDSPSLSQTLADDVFRAICWRESNWRQFTAAGLPLKNQNSNGTTDWGCMQINQATARQIWDWRDNVAAAKSVFSDKNKAAKIYLDKHPPYSADMLMRETIQRYNGGTYYSWNDTASIWEARPYNGYADAILALMASPPWPIYAGLSV